MKKYIKIISVMLLLLILINTCIETFALEIQVSNSSNQVVTKEKLEESVRGYFTGAKKASTEVDNTEFSIGIISENEPWTVEFNENEIIVNDSVYSYKIENNKVKLSHEINAKDGDPTNIDKLYHYLVFPTVFVAVTDLYGIDSNKSLYYYESIYLANRKTNTEIPSDLEVGNAMKYHQFLSTTDNFKNINNTVFTLQNEILEETDTNFKYSENLVINLDKVNSVTDFNATAYEMSNTNTEEPVVTGVENVANTSNKINTNTSTNNDLPYSGLEDDNTFISVSLILIGIALIFYVKYITLKIKEN